MHDNIGLFLSKRAHLDPTVEAFVDVASGLRLSYHELNQRANQTAHFLVGLGIKRGDRVALLMLNCPAYLELFFGLAKKPEKSGPRPSLTKKKPDPKNPVPDKH